MLQFRVSLGAEKMTVVMVDKKQEVPVATGDEAGNWTFEDCEHETVGSCVGAMVDKLIELNR